MSEPQRMEPVPHRVRDLFRDWRMGDAEKLAQMVEEASVAWPGGGGWQESAEETERDVREGNWLGYFVTEDRGRIVAVCNVRGKPGQKAHCFIPFLNCHPDYHGKKHGKSVLGACVNRAYEQGYDKVDLGTWASNLKAVPLYKKMGFMWRPDSSVHMENFTPAARRHPLARSFFRKQDWYATLKRTLELKEDVFERGDLKVYEYVWEAEEGDYLRMVFDRESWGPIEVETNDLVVSCELEQKRVIAGQPYPVGWRVVNRRTKPLSVHLKKIGDPGVSIGDPVSFEVEKEERIEGQFEIDPEIPEKREDPTAALLRSQFRINGRRADLVAGVQHDPALEVTLPVRKAFYTIGRDKSCTVTVASNLDEPCRAQVEFRPIKGVQIGRSRYRLSLEAYGKAELELPVTVDAPGPVNLAVEVTARIGRRTIPVKKTQLDFVAIVAGRFSAGIGEHRALLLGASLLVQADLREGGLSVHHRLRPGCPRLVHVPPPRLGPPFDGSDLFQEKAKASVESDDNGVTLLLRTDSVLRPGVRLERRVQVGGSPLVGVTDTIVNNSRRPYDFTVSQSWNLAAGPVELVLPRSDGISVEQNDSGRREINDLQPVKDAHAWPEGWLCCQAQDGTACGILWSRAERARPGRRGTLDRKAGRVHPEESITVDPIYFYAGDGNWEAVRAWWQTVAGDGPDEFVPRVRETRRGLTFGLEPAPLLIPPSGTKATFFARSAGKHRVDGRLSLRTPKGIRADCGAESVESLNIDRPLSRPLRLSRTGRGRKPGAANLTTTLTSEEAVWTEETDALLLGTEQPVGITREGDVYTIDNGILTVRVAPVFLGSIISLRRDGLEYVRSAYPEAHLWGVENPWHGGIRPSHPKMWGTLHKERFRPCRVRRKGSQGHIWSGVRVRSLLESEEVHGEAMTIDYLLAPGADVLAMVLGVEDVQGAVQDCGLGTLFYTSFAHRPGSDRATVLAGPHNRYTGHWDWGGLAGWQERPVSVPVGR